jgi:hypothetical protein
VKEIGNCEKNGGYPNFHLFSSQPPLFYELKALMLSAHQIVHASNSGFEGLPRKGRAREQTRKRAKQELDTRELGSV